MNTGRNRTETEIELNTYGNQTLHTLHLFLITFVIKKLLDLLNLRIRYFTKVVRTPTTSRAHPELTEVDIEVHIHDCFPPESIKGNEYERKPFGQFKSRRDSLKEKPKNVAENDVAYVAQTPENKREKTARYPGHGPKIGGSGRRVELPPGRQTTE
jgi:hypothetical protein